MDREQLAFSLDFNENVNWYTFLDSNLAVQIFLQSL
jgi:hypothetical protein